MRLFLTLLVLGTLAGVAVPASAAPKQLELLISKEDVNLETRTLKFRLNRPAASAVVRVYDAAGSMIDESTCDYNGAAANTELSITWKEVYNSVQRIELTATDVNEFWVAWEIVPFSLEIPHEEVVFESGKWDIRPTEAPKLDAALTLLIAALKEHGKDMECQVYVAGFTDTVGSVSDNRELSRQRARAIARYFQQHGLKNIAIFVRGFGEESLAVQTGDSVDEPRNRRAAYIVGVVPPDIRGPGSWTRLQ